MKDYSRPSRGRGRGNWRGRSDYHRRESYHGRHSSSSRPSYHSRKYERDRSRDRRDSHSRRDRHSRDRRERSRSRSPRRRRSRDRRSRSGSRSSYSSSSRSASRHRSSPSRSRSRTNSPVERVTPGEQGQLTRGINDQSRSQQLEGFSRSQGEQNVSPGKENVQVEHNLAVETGTGTSGRPINMTRPSSSDIGQDAYTVPPPSRWEREGSQEETESNSKGYQDSVDELYEGIADPSEKKTSLGPKEMLSPVNLQKKSLVITFSNDRFQQAPTTKAAIPIPPKEAQRVFETAVTPPHFAESDDNPAVSASADKRKSVFPAANRPMWKPIGEVDLPSPLLIEQPVSSSEVVPTKAATEVADKSGGTGKKKSKAELQKEIRDLELALEKKRSAKKVMSEDTSEETQTVGEKEPELRDTKKVRSRSHSRDSHRSSSSSSHDSSQERPKRETRGRGQEKGRKKYDKKDKTRRERGEKSRHGSKDGDKSRRGKGQNTKRRDKEEERYRDERTEKQEQVRRGDFEEEKKNISEVQDTLHASLLGDENNLPELPGQGSVVQPNEMMHPSYEASGIVSQDMAQSFNQTVASTYVGSQLVQKDVYAVDHFLQSLGLSGGASRAETSVSNSLPATLMSNTFDQSSLQLPPVQETNSFPAELQPMQEQSAAAVSDFGFTYTYQDGQNLPGLDLAVDQPPVADQEPNTGFQNADEEDEYLYGCNMSEQRQIESRQREIESREEEYIPEPKSPTEKVEKDEQLNKILSAIGFDFDMAKQIVEQTKRKEEQTKEQSQLKGARKAKKQEDQGTPDQQDKDRKEKSKANKKSEEKATKTIVAPRDDIKESTPVDAQPIPSIVRRVARSPTTNVLESSQSAQNTTSDDWSSQYYGPTTSANYFPASSTMPPMTSAPPPAVPLYGPPVPPVSTPVVQPPVLSTHGPPVPPSLGHPVLPPHPQLGLPPELSLPHGPPLPPQGPHMPPNGLPGTQFDASYGHYLQGPFPHVTGQQQWPHPGPYDQVGHQDVSYYKRSISPGNYSRGKYSRSHSRSTSFSRSRSRSFSDSASFSSSRSRSRSPPKRSSPRVMKQKPRKFQEKRVASDLDSDEKSSKKKKKKKAKIDDKRGNSKETSKRLEKEKVPKKGREESKDKNSVKGIKVSLSRDQDKETSRRIITMPKSRSSSPERKDKHSAGGSSQDEKRRQEKEKFKKEADLLLKHQEQLLIERMEKRKREMEKELEREKRQKEKELASLGWAFEKREKEIKKREEIIMRVEDKLRKQQEKRAMAEMKMEEEQQRKLKKEKEDFKRRLQFLQKELDRLKKNQGDLLRKKQKEKDGHKDPELMENNQLQEEILNQIKRLQLAYSEAYGKPLPEEPEEDREREEKADERSRNSRERSPRKSRRSQDQKESSGSSERGRQREKEREPPEGKSRFNFVYFDSGDHWCMYCNKVLSDINGFLIHLHSKKHMKNCDPHDRPWKTMSPQEKKPAPSTSSSSTIQTPFKGELLLVPTNAFYCRLCKIFLGDVLCASEHVRQRSHNLKYLKFTDENRFYEKQLSIRRESVNPPKDSSSEAEDDKPDDVKGGSDEVQKKEKEEVREDTPQQKRKLPFVGRRPGYSRKTRFDAKETSLGTSKPSDSPDQEKEKEEKAKEDENDEKGTEGEEVSNEEVVIDEEKVTDASDKEMDDGKKDSKFKFKFSSGKKVKSSTTSSATSTSPTASKSTVTKSPVSSKPPVSAPKSFPMIGKRPKSKLVISRPEAQPEPEPKQDTEDKYKEMKNSLDLFLQMKSGSLPVVVEKGKEKQEAAAKDAGKTTAPPPPPNPPPLPPPPVAGQPGETAGVTNRDNIAKAYQDIAEKEKERQAVPPPLPNIPPLHPTGVSDVINETLTTYSSAHQYKMASLGVAPPIMNTSLPPPPPPDFMIAAGIIPMPPTLPAPIAPPLLPTPPQMPNETHLHGPPPPPPPGTQEGEEDDVKMNDYLAEYGELLPDTDDDDDEEEDGDNEAPDEGGKGRRDGEKNASSGSEMEDEYLYWY
ncbi:uncharacterized protein [Apostichopus japonicus]|uniref:uncharacterized protein isoform X2 n=1 Tax=Stichopus japonicus TaxID=307972 RepID=UPI003AB8CEB0